MDIDIAAAYDSMVKIVADAANVNTGMAALIDYCDTVYPSNLWNSIRILNYVEDEARLRQWLVSVFTNEPVPPAVKTFWCGMFNPVIDDEASCALYISGSPRDYSPESLDWACFRQDTYRPSQYVAKSQILHTVYRTV
ncbi:MAG: hypothetical protein ABIY70_28115 [Capsulimonas sp.]|uniref:hypothetical protein n=1 Tax=Capsulimonas sp. TaxID=2494211 RepID=UPI00326781E5